MRHHNAGAAAFGDEAHLDGGRVLGARPGIEVEKQSCRRLPRNNPTELDLVTVVCALPEPTVGVKWADLVITRSQALRVA